MSSKQWSAFEKFSHYQFKSKCCLNKISYSKTLTPMVRIRLLVPSGVEFHDAARPPTPAGTALALPQSSPHPQYIYMLVGGGHRSCIVKRFISHRGSPCSRAALAQAAGPIFQGLMKRVSFTRVLTRVYKGSSKHALATHTRNSQLSTPAGEEDLPIKIVGLAWGEKCVLECEVERPFQVQQPPQQEGVSASCAQDDEHVALLR